MIFVALPSALTEKSEDWYVSQVSQLTKVKEGDDLRVLPKRFRDQPPEEVLKEMDAFLEEEGQKSSVVLKVEKPGLAKPLRVQKFSWVLPIVLHHVEKFQKATQGGRFQRAADGYSICFDNQGDDQARIVFDVVLASEANNMADDDATYEEDGKTVRKQHLTPLEEELAASITAANSILNEMKYMEKREQRMRQTADSINQKIQWFSYVSIVVLFGVTYLQVTYLKRYFKKKKLM